HATRRQDRNRLSHRGAGELQLLGKQPLRGQPPVHRKAAVEHRPLYMLKGALDSGFHGSSPGGKWVKIGPTNIPEPPRWLKIAAMSETKVAGGQRPRVYLFAT